MAAITAHLVGRDEELASIDRLLSELDQGSAAAIEIRGEPGIGKTRLLAELGARADERGWLVLAGSGSELERDLPFSVFVDALDEYLRGLDPSHFAILGDDESDELAHVFPALSGLAATNRVELQHERYRAHRAVRALLEHLAADKPMVLVLDDLHWADAASVELLGALLRRRPSAPVLFAMAARPNQVPAHLSSALERSLRDDALTRIELGALSPDETRELLGGTVEDSDTKLLYEESGGNPFYLEQLVRTHERGVGATHTRSTSPSDGGVPPAIAASLIEELALLSEDQRRVLEGASVVGDPFEPELAAAAAETSQSEAMGAVDELIRLDLVRTTDVPRRFRFRHPLVRRAVYEAAPAGWRLGAHQRCAEALEERGASAAERAGHIERSAREGDLGAVTVLREAGETARRLAPASAAHWFEQALRLLPATAPAQERVDLLLARSGALTATGHFADSHAALVEALEIVPRDSPAMNATLTRACAGVESLLGLNEQAHDRLARAIEHLPDRNSSEAVALMIELSLNNFWRARYGPMHGSAERAVSAARELGEAPLIAAGLATLALADSLMGAAERVERERAEAAAIVESLSDEELGRHVDAAALLAGAELYLDDYVEADRHAGRALTVARGTGQGEKFLVLIEILGGVWRQRGKLSQAAELLDGGIESARLLGNSHALVWSLSGRSSAALRMGDLELALATARESVDLSSDSAGNFHSAEAAAGLAAALLESGQPEPAIELLVGSAGGEGLELIAGSPRAYYLEVLTRCRLALDRHSEAKRSAVSAAEWAATVRLPMASAWADRAGAAVDLAAGDAAAASQRALTSAAKADEVGAPVEAALSRTLAGMALGIAGARDRALEELQAAAATFETCGALRYRDHAERELRKLGHRIHRRTRPGAADGTGLESLTGRELQVARLVVDRMTNPEIAETLFLSQKTVETHLSNIFRKLDVESRVALARAVERSDRAG